MIDAKKHMNTTTIGIITGILIFLVPATDTVKAETVTLTFSGDEEYKLTFESSLISAEQIKEIVKISPQHDGKYFLAPSLELCIVGNLEYLDCDTRDFSAAHFYENGQVNLNKGRKSLDLLKNTVYPKELTDIKAYFEKSLIFSLWLEETKFKFYQSWDIAVLKKKHEELDPSALCADVLEKIKSTKDNYSKYKLVKHEWHNCLNHVFRSRLGEYPLQVWKQFLADYEIQEEVILLYDED